MTSNTGTQSPNGGAIAAVALYPGVAALAWRHIVSWMALSVAAGAVNAGAFVVCERFVTHVTGTITMIGMDAHRLLLMLEYILVLVAFIAGAMASVLPVQARAYQGKAPLYRAPLVVVAFLTGCTAIAGHLGVFGPIGGTVEEPADFGFLCILGFLMGLLNASVGTNTGLAIRATHMTGPATDFGVHLATAWLLVGEQRRTALSWAALRAGKMMAFALGAVLMVPAMRSGGYLGFLLPTALFLPALRSFVPVPALPSVVDGAVRHQR